MRRLLIIGLAALLLIVVAGVFISPLVDLNPAAFRSPFWAFALLICFAVFDTLLAIFRMAQIPPLRVLRSRLAAAFPPPHHVYELTCARLC